VKNSVVAAMKIMSSMALTFPLVGCSLPLCHNLSFASRVVNQQSKYRGPLQNLTIIARSIKDSFLRRSGNHTLLSPPPHAVSAGPRLVCPEEVPLLQVKN
jgi:hypothetical protein